MNDTPDITTITIKLSNRFDELDRMTLDVNANEDEVTKTERILHAIRKAHWVLADGDTIHIEEEHAKR